MRTLDPENGSKMMGLLLIQDNSDKELIRLAFGPEHLLHALVAIARVEIAGKPTSPPSPVLGPSGNRSRWLNACVLTSATVLTAQIRQ